MENNRHREEENELNEETNIPQDGETEDNKTYADYLHEQNNEETIPEEKPQEKHRNHKKKKNPLFDENQKLIKENNDLKDQLLRSLAELENFKKRTNEERIKDRKYALSDFLMELIDVVDIFDKAVNVKTEDEKLQKFLNGFVMVNKSFKQILKRNGVEAIDALNKPFDPAFHSAVETVKVEGVEPHIVVEVIMTGYTYKDRVLRPSMVKVSE